MNTSPLISVVIPVYHEPIRYIKLAIDSMLQQTYSNLEIIIAVDNPDRTELVDFVKQLAATDQRVKPIINKQNIGIYLTRNNATKKVKGDYVAVMDADDISVPHRLQTQMDFLQDNPNIDLVGSSEYVIDADGNKVAKHPKTVAPDLTKYTELELLQYGMFACHPTWLLKTSVYKQLNYYNPFKFASDYDFSYRFALAGFKAANIGEALLYKRLWLTDVDARKKLIQIKSHIYTRKYLKRGLKFNLQQYTKATTPSSLTVKLHQWSRIIEHSSFLGTSKFAVRMRKNLAIIVSPYRLYTSIKGLSYNRKFSK